MQQTAQRNALAVQWRLHVGFRRTLGQSGPLLAAAPSGALQAWLDSGIEHGDQLDQLLGVALVGNLSRRCDVPAVQTRDWSAQIDALTGEE